MRIAVIVVWITDDRSYFEAEAGEFRLCCGTSGEEDLPGA